MCIRRLHNIESSGLSGVRINISLKFNPYLINKDNKRGISMSVLGIFVLNYHLNVYFSN